MQNKGFLASQYPFLIRCITPLSLHNLDFTLDQGKEIKFGCDLEGTSLPMIVNRITDTQISVFNSLHLHELKVSFKSNLPKAYQN